MAELLLPSGSGQGGIDPDELTATAADVIKGKIAGVNGSDEPIEGTLEVQSVINFNVAQYSSLTLLASWALPAKGPWSGLRIMCKQGDYPSSPQDGTLFYEGSAASAIKALAAGTWYFRAWNYMNSNYGCIYGQYRSTMVSNVQIKGQQVFTNSGRFVVPAGVFRIDVFCTGGGGGGSMSGSNDPSVGGGGGGSGYTSTRKSIAVTPGQTFDVIIGAGGAGGYQKSYADEYSGKAGGTTSFSNLLTAKGGNDLYRSRFYGGYGGSGGGGGFFRRTEGYGGSNGSDGSNGDQYGNYRGIGQQTTTRAFGESSGTLYAGGGGGSSGNSSVLHTGGSGGGGNGSRLSDNNWLNSSAGISGTGGGGGGSYLFSASNGGSGNCIIRWGY